MATFENVLIEVYFKIFFYFLEKLCLLLDILDFLYYEPFHQKSGIIIMVFITLLHDFIQQSLNSGSAQVQILLGASQRIAMMRISDNGLSWK